MEGVTEGRVVHYVVADWDGIAAAEGQHRPAMIVRDWKTPTGTVNLQVFCDGQNDGAMQLWRTSVLHDPGGAPGTWHWIERA